jgi:glycosyltransferase involved in cell wall biosynthesis
MEVRRVSESLFVCTPHLPQHSVDPWQAQRDLLDGMFLEYAVFPAIFWFYTPMALPLMQDVAGARVVYDCMDELSGFHGAPTGIVEREASLLRAATVVFTGGWSLFEEKRRSHPRVHAFPSSVDAAHFAAAREPLAEPVDQASLPHPRLGFFGVIDERMDLDLVRRVAESRRAWQLVFLGPVVKIDAASLPRLPNVHWLGMKDYAELPAYISSWDVAIMPFALNAATKFISPTKTLEYLAAGKPVVSTNVRDVARTFGEQGLARIAAPEGFVDAVERALVEAPAERLRLVDEYLRSTSWDGTFENMVALIEGEG